MEMTNGKLWARSFEGAVNVYRGKIMAFTADHLNIGRSTKTRSRMRTNAYTVRFELLICVFQKRFLFALKVSFNIIIFRDR